jgi:signal transduction histidine kinase
MEKGEIYRALEEDFTATFIKELIPGILHNFANPLNGIMGRSKLLQRRFEENMKKIEESYPDTAVGMMEELQRIRNDIRSVSQESEFFFDMFRDVAGKFYALATKGDDRINLSQLLAAEMRFADFYLDYKHEIKKDIQLEKDVYEFRASSADLSLAFWRIIRFAMVRALTSRLKEFSIKTEQDNRYTSVFIKSSGNSMPAADIKALMENLEAESWDLSSTVIDRGVLLALLLFSKYEAKINIFSEDNFTTISIGFPHRPEKALKKET